MQDLNGPERTDGQLWLGKGGSTATLSANLDLTFSSGQFQALTASGANRDANLPAVGAAQNGAFFWFYNAGASNSVLVKTATPSTLATLAPKEFCLVCVEGGVWLLKLQYSVSGSVTITVDAAATSVTASGAATGASGTANTGNGTASVSMGGSTASGVAANGATTATNNATVLSKFLSLGAPAAPDGSNVHAPFSGNNGSNNFPGPFVAPVAPRNLTVGFAGGWDGGNVNVVGTDQFDASINETFTANPGNTVTGVKVFKTVLSATKGAIGVSADPASIGMGSKLGLTTALSANVGVISVDSVTEVATWDSTYSGVTPTTAPDGGKVFVAFYPASITVAQASHNHTDGGHTHAATGLTATDAGHAHSGPSHTHTAGAITITDPQHTHTASAA